MVINKVYDLPNLSASHHFCLNATPDGSRIVEFGTATGYMSRILREEKRCSVTGVEYSPEAAEKAAQYCDKMIIGDIEDNALWQRFDPPYDAVIFADVLEHLRNPTAVLRRCRALLKPDGKAIISLPNIAHWTIRRNLLRGRFDYTQYGILDNTHLRFFTEKTLRAMIDEAGFRLEKLEYSTHYIPMDRLFTRLKLGRLKRRLNRWAVRRYPNLLGFQMMVVCRPDQSLIPAPESG